jgi:hypothetical protein
VPADLQNNGVAWSDYTPHTPPAETARMSELVRAPDWAAALLNFRFRPVGPMDLNPYEFLDSQWRNQTRMERSLRVARKVSPSLSWRVAMRR